MFDTTPNADFLNALAFKRNWQGMEAQRQNELAYAQQLNALQERDFQKEAALQQQAKDAIAKLDELPLVDRDRAEMKKKIDALGKNIQPLIEKHSGDIPNAWKSREFQQALMGYQNDIANSLDPKWKQNAIAYKAMENAVKSGNVLMPSFDKNDNPLLTPEEHLAAYNRGDIDNIAFPDAYKPKGDDIYKAIQSANAPNFAQWNDNPSEQKKQMKLYEAGNQIYATPTYAATAELQISNPKLYRDYMNGGKAGTFVYNKLVDKYTQTPAAYKMKDMMPMMNYNLRQTQLGMQQDMNNWKKDQAQEKKDEKGLQFGDVGDDTYTRDVYVEENKDGKKELKRYNNLESNVNSMDVINGGKVKVVTDYSINPNYIEMNRTTQNGTTVTIPDEQGEKEKIGTHTISGDFKRITQIGGKGGKDNLYAAIVSPIGGSGLMKTEYVPLRTMSDELKKKGYTTQQVRALYAQKIKGEEPTTQSVPSKGGEKEGNISNVNNEDLKYKRKQ